MSWDADGHLARRAVWGAAGLGLLGAGALALAGGPGPLPLQPESVPSFVFMLLLTALVFLAEALILGRGEDAGRRKVALFAFPFLAMAALAAFKARFGLQDPLYFGLVREDGVVETATFLFLALATVPFLRAARLSWRAGGRVVPGLLALGGLFTLLVALEEISYGQRIFGYATPSAVEQVNTQKEFNIHNIKSLAEITYVILPNIVLFYTLFGWVLLWMAARVAPRRSSLWARLTPLVVPWPAAAAFLPLFIYRSFELNGYPVNTCCAPGQFLVWQDQEPAEMMFGLGFLLFGMHALSAVRGTTQPPGGRASPKA